MQQITLYKRFCKENKHYFRYPIIILLNLIKVVLQTDYVWLVCGRQSCLRGVGMGISLISHSLWGKNKVLNP